MKYKISISTYNPDIVTALSSLGYKKAQFIEQALSHFLSTQKGRTMMNLMLGNAPKISFRAEKKTKGPLASMAVREGGDKISIDNFLD